MFSDDTKVNEINHSTKAQLSENLPYRIEELKAATSEKLKKIKETQRIQVIEFGVVPSSDAPTMRKGLMRLNTIHRNEKEFGMVMNPSSIQRTFDELLQESLLDKNPNKHLKFLEYIR